VTKNRFVQASKRTGNSASKKIATDSARNQQQQQQQQQLCGNSKHEQRTKSLHEHQLQQQQQVQQAPIEGSRSQTSERSNIVSGASFVSLGGEESPMELEGSSQSTY
jgi:hypothetical protein